MGSSLGIETPAAKIATARSAFAMAVRLNAEAIAGRIRRTIFERRVVVITGGSGLMLPPDHTSTTEDLLKGIFNLVLVALSTSALVADETLTEFLGPLDQEQDSSQRALRIMVNQVRNAFAHNPLRPKWVVFKKYRNIYQVTLDDGSTFHFNAMSLNGDGVKPEQVGGLEFWVKPLQHCERLVA